MEFQFIYDNTMIAAANKSINQKIVINSTEIIFFYVIVVWFYEFLYWYEYLLLICIENEYCFVLILIKLRQK